MNNCYNSSELIASPNFTLKEIGEIVNQLYENDDDRNRLTGAIMVDPHHFVIDTELNIAVIYLKDVDKFSILTTRRDASLIDAIYGVNILK